MVDGTALWLGARGFVVREVSEDGDELVVAIETTTELPVGCSACGTPARAKDRRRVRLRDAPVGDRPVQLEWHKRIWSCPDPDCATKTWTEQRPELALPRRVLTARAARWACARVAALEGTPASCARTLGVSWATTWAAVIEHGTPLVDDPARVGETVMVGFDETVMQPAHRRRRRRFVSAVVDVTSGQILDLFEGRDAKDLQAWLDGMPASWRAAVRVVSVDPHEGYRSALTRTSLLCDVTMVVDPFHIVRLANMAVTRCRQRVQQQTLGHRGRARDPLFGARKLFLLGAERVDERGWDAIWSALRAATLTVSSRTPTSPRRRSATSTSPTTPTSLRSRSTTRSPGAAHPKPARNSDASPRRCDGGGPRSSLTTPRGRATVPSKPRTC